MQRCSPGEAWPATFWLVGRYKATFDMPLRLAVGERAMAIAGRVQDRLQGARSRGVTGPVRR